MNSRRGMAWSAARRQVERAANRIRDTGGNLDGGISIGLVIVLLLVLAAELLNGSTDAPNSIATVVSTRVLSPGQAVLMATVLNAVGVLSGTAVAETIGSGFVESEVVNLSTIGAAMSSIVIWTSVTWYLGLPTSESHALVASLTGAAYATGGREALVWSGWEKVLQGLGLSSVLGFASGLLIMVCIFWVFRGTRPGRLRRRFGRLQVLSAAFMAFSHGRNDGQKFMGVFALALLIHGSLPKSEGLQIPVWVILTCATVTGVGTALGGWRIIHTLGMRMARIGPPEGFAAESGAALTIELASAYGIPISTTHTISTSIMGVGAVRRAKAVRWGVVREIVLAWILTFPVCAVIGWGVAMILRWIG